jgi:hypothetical protein
MVAIVLACACLTFARSKPKALPKKPPAPPAAAQPAMPPSLPSYKFPDGLVLHYKAEWRLLSAGEATLRLDPAADGKKQISAVANSTGFVSRLYHVHDVFESAFNGATFCSDHIHKHTEEGFRKRDEMIHFDYAKHKSEREEMDLTNGRRQQVENDLPPCATDVLSALFFAASLPLQQGATYSFPLNDGGKTGTIQLVTEGKERLKTGAGVFNTLRVQPIPDPGMMKNRGRIWLWYSDDAQRLPIQMRAHMGWGTLTLSLDRIDHTPAAAAK